MAGTIDLIKERHVNSERLRDLVVEEITGDYNIGWSNPDDRDDFVQRYLTYVFDELIEQKEVTQFKATCDKRNNKQSDMDNGIYYLDVYYKQWNCVNDTHLTFKIKHIHTGAVNFF